MDTAETESRTHRKSRLVARCAALAAAVALAWPLVSGDLAVVVLPALSPHIALLAALALRSVGVLTLLGVPVLVLVWFRPRWFCRCACPTGLLQELVSRLRPNAASRWSRLPPLGQWILLLSLGGAALGYPFLLWLDPLAIFASFVSATRQSVSAAMVVGMAGLLLLLLLAFLIPNLWCMRLCPLGALQEMIAKLSRVPREPDGAEVSAPPRSLARRAILGVGLGVSAGWLLRQSRCHATPPLRPPGAADEQRFAGLCIRCGNCVRSCPAKVIVPDFGGSGVAGFMAPVMNFDKDYCHENCNACGQACPSGAIARLTLARKYHSVIGTARVATELCVMIDGHDCSACIMQCPYEALTRKESDSGFAAEPEVNNERCTGCGACEAACPVRPVRAITVAATMERNHP